MFERVLKPEFVGRDDEDLAFEYGPDFKTICYEMQPTKALRKPSDALVIKLLESWNPKRYGSHQTIDVNYGGVLRLEKDAKPEAITTTAVEVFEDEPPTPAEQRGGHLALAAPAKSSAEFEARAAAGEFDQAPVTFRDASGAPAALRPDIAALRDQVAELRARGPKNPVPLDKDGRRVIDPNLSKPGRADQADDEGRGLRPSYAKPYRPPEAKENPPVLPQRPANSQRVGEGVEGVGDGPDPERIGPHQGFRVA